MLDKATLLLFLHLVACSISSPLYPALRYSPGPVAGKAMSFQLQHSSPLQSQNPSAEEQEEEGLLADPSEKRMQRHADAIFTDNYRKFLGQISARKFLQTIIGKRLGSSGSSPEGVQEFLTRRQSDSILMDSRYHHQMVLRDFLGAILQNQRPQDIDSSRLEGFPSTWAKLIISELVDLMYSGPFTAVKTLPDVSSWKLMHTLLSRDQSNAVLRHYFIPFSLSNRTPL